MAKPTPWVDPVTMTTRPFTPASRRDFVNSHNFGSEILIVKLWKFHNRSPGHNRRMGIDKWNFFAKIVAAA
jgi:hypothetical protein